MIAGVLGGTVSTITLLPLDNIKVRMQVHENSGDRLASLRIIRGIIRHEGIAGLYQGLTPAIIGSSVSWGGFFFVYEGFKKLLRQRNGLDENSPLSSIANFQLACASGGVMVCLTNPIWLIKLRMQLQMKKTSERLKDGPKPYNGMVHAARTIVKEEGFWALYKGTAPALLLTSHGGVQFVVYEALKKHYHYTRAERDTAGSVLERLEESFGFLAMGAVSKMIASTATYPLQVVKARMQQRSEYVELTSDGNVKLVKRDVTGILETSKRIWQKEGILGYFNGCLPNAVKVAPSAAVTFVVYEFVMDTLNGK
jgi:solute carrier family 25 folate transporter 32